jgi:hypothetical protein
VTAEPDTSKADPRFVVEAVTALDALRGLRQQLDDWEPELVAAARNRGASWATLAPALGVASRQAAERRYLRSRRPTPDETSATRDERVQAERDRRAGDRAVTNWVRRHGSDIRQLAGQVSGLTDLGKAARPSLARLHDALGDDDVAGLVPLLAEAGQHLPARHGGLARRVEQITESVTRVRAKIHRERARQRTMRA